MFPFFTVDMLNYDLPFFFFCDFSVGHYVFVRWIVFSDLYVMMLELTCLLHYVIDEHTLEYQWFMTHLFRFGHICILGHTPIFDVSIGFTSRSSD